MYIENLMHLLETKDITKIITNIVLLALLQMLKSKMFDIVNFHFLHMKVHRNTLNEYNI
jgi:hypothetical protein